MAGQTVPVPPPPLPIVGGAQPPLGSLQLHWQGGQAVPGAQPGQAQPQPPDGGGTLR
jgi:hypothetical protein